MNEQRIEKELAAAATFIMEADALIIGAGAGMGVDSGLPDFRGKNGFWRAYPALGKRNIRFEEIATPEAFQRRAYTTWGFYGHRLLLYRRTAPHAGFAILREFSATMKYGAFVFTSNVDGQLLQRSPDPVAVFGLLSAELAAKRMRGETQKRAIGFV